jgi:hypothetical protein
MNAVPFVAISVVAAMSMSAQTPGAQKGKVNVQIVVGTLAAHQTACKDGKGVSPTTVFVSEKEVFHCVGGALLNHKDEMTKPEAFKQTLVQLTAGDSITWTANVAFRVVQVRKHEPIAARGAAYPFTDDLSTEFTKSVTLGAVLDLEGSVVQQYKVAFEIQGIGRVDPDLVCSM